MQALGNLLILASLCARILLYSFSVSRHRTIGDWTTCHKSREQLIDVVINNKLKSTRSQSISGQISAIVSKDSRALFAEIASLPRLSNI
ncbi:hypothetical protein BDV24DRAFT_137892 [Aspergillus arachidicola]|uniref:Secreted protein n=1 Tax=Aspergillus arachidicola TaxID=656916 RepID=A0A5N6XZA2_9EURO|nr:hypothetical protein BDV24DRAFT_137892 [Aspergillus arachidicola]